MYSQESKKQMRRSDGQKLSNTDLLRGLESRSPLAAKEFHRRYSARICRMVWHILGADFEHDDLVQQVFVNIFSSLSTIIDPAALDSWVTGVTYKTVRYELRKRKVRRALFGRSSSVSSNTECDVDQDVFQDFRSPFKESHIRKFYQILDHLPANDRIILVLKYVEGNTVEQIAAAGNYSRSTAKRRLNKARERFMKKALRDFSLISLVEECHAT